LTSEKVLNEHQHHIIKAPAIPASIVKNMGSALNFVVAIIVNEKIIKPGKLMNDIGLFNIPRLKKFSRTMEFSEKKTTAEAIKPTVAGLIPNSMLFTIELFLNLSKNDETISISISEGRETPKVAKMEPNIPADLYPTYVAAFTAIGPGVICDMATTSENSEAFMKEKV